MHAGQKNLMVDSDIDIADTMKRQQRKLKIGEEKENSKWVQPLAEGKS